MWFKKEFEQSEMSFAREASVLVRQVAEPRTVGDSVKAAIGRAARRLGWPYNRTKDIWYANARRIDASEYEALRKATAEIRETTNRLLALRDALAAKDSAFHWPEICALERALCGMGCDVESRGVRGTETRTDGAE